MRPAVALAGAGLAGLGVALGAFGAHALKAELSPAQLGWWNTAVDYQMWHALALLVLALLPVRRVVPIAGLLGCGILLFSGSLYLMALTGWRWLGPVTPIGGSAMIAGWGLLVFELVRAARHRP